jgi:hypothetical protein
VWHAACNVSGEEIPMRPDMHKVVTERPRHGRHKRIATQTHMVARSRLSDEAAAEGLAKREGMRWQHGRCRSFSDLLGPLQKFFGRRVGRRWDDVYSEVCKGLGGQSTTLQHIRDHVAHMVVLPVEHGRTLRPGQIYVDGKGIIRRVPFAKRPRRTYRSHEDQLLEALNAMSGEARMEVRDGKLWRLHRDALTGAFSVRNEATARHAARDLAACDASRLAHLRWLAAHVPFRDAPYLAALLERAV